MKRIATIIATLLTAGSAYGDDLHLVSLDRLGLEGYNIVNNRDPYFPYSDPGGNGKEYWTKGVATLVDIDLINYGLFDVYWRNRIHGETTNVQFREVGWQYEGGIELKDYIDIYWQHHSEHILDSQGQYGKFPLENEYGVRLTVYKRDR